MTRETVSRLARVAAIIVVAIFPRTASAQLPLGTWLRTDLPREQSMTMTVEACCNGGRRLVYRVAGSTQVMLTVDSPMDGSEVPVLVGGKPSGETMAIKIVDKFHSVTILKMNGQPYGTSKGTLSADGNSLTVENEVAQMAGQPAGKATEKWARQK
jgi:hypothetical protein